MGRIHLIWGKLARASLPRVAVLRYSEMRPSLARGELFCEKRVEPHSQRRYRASPSVNVPRQVSISR